MPMNSKTQPQRAAGAPPRASFSASQSADLLKRPRTFSFSRRAARAGQGLEGCAGKQLPKTGKGQIEVRIGMVFVKQKVVQKGEQAKYGKNCCQARKIAPAKPDQERKDDIELLFYAQAPEVEQGLGMGRRIEIACFSVKEYV